MLRPGLVHDSLDTLASDRPFFFFHATATTEIYTLSLHDALPISPASTRSVAPARAGNRPITATASSSRTAGSRGVSGSASMPIRHATAATVWRVVSQPRQ